MLFLLRSSVFATMEALYYQRALSTSVLRPPTSTILLHGDSSAFCLLFAHKNNVASSNHKLRHSLKSAKIIYTMDNIDNLFSDSPPPDNNTTNSTTDSDTNENTNSSSSYTRGGGEGRGSGSRRGSVESVINTPRSPTPEDSLTIAGM